MNTLKQSPPDPDFPQLMTQLRARLHRYCARMAGSVLDGEDIVQETLIKANENYDARQIQNVEGWLFRIAHNAAMDFLRKRAHEQTIVVENLDLHEDPAAGADRRHVAATALRTFMRLPPTQRSAVILCDVLEYSLDETAAVMAATVPAVKAALHRGRERLREISELPDNAAPAPSLSAADQRLLAAFAERFNNRDFDGLRDLLGEDVRLDLVARRKPMQARRGEYFTRYSEQTRGIVAIPMNLEGRPALWMDVRAEEGAMAQGYVIVLQRSDKGSVVEGEDEKIAAIRDFRYARYAVQDLGFDPRPYPTGQ